MNLPPIVSTAKQPTSNSSFKFAAFSKYKEQLTAIFDSQVSPLYGDQAFNIERFTSGTSRRCEAARFKGKIVGAISYLNKLQTIGEISKSFEVRNLLLTKKKYYERGYQEELYNRVAKLATDRQASQIHFLIASTDEVLIDFLKTKGFEQKGEDTISKDKKEALIFCRMIDRANGPAALQEEVNDKKKTEKRKRDEKDDGSVLNKNAGKKSCLESIEIGESKEFILPALSQNPETKQAPFKPIPLDFGSGIRHQDSPLSSRSTYTSPANRPPSLPRSYSTSALNQNDRGRRHELTLRKIYIHQIRNGQKTVEGRIYSTVRQYQAGDTIRFFYGACPNDDVTCKILKIEKYASFPEMLQKCGFQKCLAEVRSLQQAEQVYDSIPNYPQRAAQHGVAAIHLEVIR